eukprot:10959_1
MERARASSNIPNSWKSAAGVLETSTTKWGMSPRSPSKTVWAAVPDTPSRKIWSFRSHMSEGASAREEVLETRILRSWSGRRASESPSCCWSQLSCFRCALTRSMRLPAYVLTMASGVALIPAGSMGCVLPFCFC